jgi:hypothetical protein
VAELICKDFLKIPVVQLTADKQVRLVPVGTGRPDLSDDLSDDEDRPDDDPDDDELEQSKGMEGATISALTKLAARHTACYATLCDDLDDAIAEAQNASSMVPKSVSYQAVPELNVIDGPHGGSDVNTSFRSELVNSKGKFLIDHMLMVSRKLQRGTTTDFEHVIRIDPKFAL